jgi:hypothetical protein
VLIRQSKERIGELMVASASFMLIDNPDETIVSPVDHELGMPRREKKWESPQHFEVLFRWHCANWSTQHSRSTRTPPKDSKPKTADS